MGLYRIGESTYTLCDDCAEHAEMEDGLEVIFIMNLSNDVCEICHSISYKMEK